MNIKLHHNLSKSVSIEGETHICFYLNMWIKIGNIMAKLTYYFLHHNKRNSYGKFTVCPVTTSYGPLLSLSPP